MENAHDLTTRSGYEQAMSFLKDYGWAISPVGWLVYKLFSPEVSTDTQIKAVENLIKVGKEQGVKSMNIKVSHQAGVDISSAFPDLPIAVKFGNNGFAEIQVEYK